MKKYSIIALLVTLVASLSSCNDDFMQRDPIAVSYTHLRAHET